MSKNKIKNLAKSPWKMKLFMLLNLPMGFIAGLKITDLTSARAQISVPYKYINKNPFNQ